MPSLASYRVLVLSLSIGCLTLVIFLIDALTPLNIAIAVLYGAVILLAATIWSARNVIRLALTCLLLTMVAYALGHRLDFFGTGFGRCLVSLSAITIITFLALKSQSTTNALRKREEALRLADQQKNEFLAMLAHELRNPIAPISSAAYLLQASPLEKQLIQETTDVIIRQSEHLTGLVEDLLDVSRIQRRIAILDKNEINLQPVISEAVEQMQPLIKAAGHQFTMQLPEEQYFVLGEHKRLVQVLSNLLTNSVKYTPEGGRIWLHMYRAEDRIVLEVKDSGIGISSELLPHVFDLFTQGTRSPDRQQGGLGIGLALVKDLVELHGGTVEASSDGHYTGSTFTVKLPYISSSKPRPAHQAIEPAKAHRNNLRILVVDDNPDVARMLTKYLIAVGLDATAVFGPKEALAIVEHHTFDVYLLDIGLPEIDGYELVRRLKRMPNAAKALMVAISGYGQQHNRQKAHNYGFDHYFVKPVNPIMLVALLNQWRSADSEAAMEVND